jgi:hypothetical protein
MKNYRTLSQLLWAIVLQEHERFFVVEFEHPLSSGDTWNLNPLLLWCIQSLLRSTCCVPKILPIVKRKPFNVDVFIGGRNGCPMCSKYLITRRKPIRIFKYRYLPVPIHHPEPFITTNVVGFFSTITINKWLKKTKIKEVRYIRFISCQRIAMLSCFVLIPKITFFKVLVPNPWLVRAAGMAAPTLSLSVENTAKSISFYKSGMIPWWRTAPIWWNPL